MLRLAIYAIHPIMYQTPIFAALQARIDKDALPIDLRILFGDDLSLRATYFAEIATVFRPDTPNLLAGYQYRFLKNLASDPRAGFFSRINIGIVFELIRWRPSVILIHGYESLTSWLALTTAKILGIKVIWRGEAAPRPRQHWLYKFVKRVALGIYFSMCDAILYSCSGNREFLIEFLGSRAETKPMALIPCAVDNQYFRQQFLDMRPQRDDLRKGLGLSPTDYCIIFCARLTDRKRPTDLLLALSRISDPHLVALFVGDGPERSRLEAMSRDLGVRAIFTGFKNQSEIGKYYSCADAAAVISSYDPSPKAMNEAMNFSLPIIAAREVGTATDLVVDMENGVLIDAADISALERGIVFLKADRTRSARLGERSAGRVSDWNYEKNVGAILATVESVTRKPGGHH